MNRAFMNHNHFWASFYVRQSGQTDAFTTMALYRHSAWQVQVCCDVPTKPA